ncbi:hypothetical protein GCM10027030_20260 [Luteococcus sediminum]
MLVNIWQVGEGVPARLQAEASAQEVDFAAIPAWGDRLRSGSLGAVMGSLMGLPTIDRVEHAPRLPFDDGGHHTARTVVVVNLALTSPVTTAQWDRIVEAGWTLITH